jgi:outer membrane protein OmpA-like peptidoglycan-associated protein
MAMRTLLLLTGTIFSMACANRAPKLEDPVGQTTTTDRVTPRPTQAASAGASQEGDSGVAGESTDPCGAEPPIVQFNGTSTEIDEPQLQELRRLASCLNAAPHDKNNVVLVGYTDLIGTVSANLELGLTRAQVVMKHLVGGGVAPGRIVVTSAGELQRPRARMGLHAPRVEILLARGGPARPNEAPITRGIDAEGLMPRPRQAPSPTNAAPTARPRPAPKPAGR